ncbi:MAG: hypothetical protein R3320_14740 [Nitriliruptorales bacterium]|nr:hypothetical protein [Nitriliruptorales bacterium]
MSPTSQEEFLELMLQFTWSLWGELGLSTWGRRHGGWLLDLEPLIVFTGTLAAQDRRLLREAATWCVEHQHFISMNQLRHVLKNHDWPNVSDFGHFGATVAMHSGRTWPGAEAATAFDVQPGQTRRLSDLSASSLLQLRLRAMFGTGARAEIVRFFLATKAPERSASEIARHVSYSQRQVANDLDALVLSGLLQASKASGPTRYWLSKPRALEALAGDLPNVVVDWPDLLFVIAELADALRVLDAEPLRAPDVEVARRLRELAPSMRRLRIDPPSLGERSAVDEFRHWALAVVTALSEADPSAMELSAFGDA